MTVPYQPEQSASGNSEQDHEELFTEKEVTLADALEHGITEEEYGWIQEFLGGRNPTVTELGIYSGLWSEHASYKNSILQLKRLPTDSPRILSRAGEENAGALDIGDGLAVVFKIESHNHPTAIEPYQGAATGVGGIMRDIFTMGARPICSLNSLRFGPPDTPHSRYLLSRAVQGIGDYGNSLGIAVSGGELFFDSSFTRNVLVNAMTVGIVQHDRMASAKAEGAGNSVFVVGATTGRDGIHGASFASRDLSAESESKRSAVQVGDPFMEKLLLEATLELIASGALVGIQDMGAAGLSCASSEMSAKGKAGMDLNLDLVPLREEGMSAYEIMLSESQERMLVVAKPGREQQIIDIFQKWELNAVAVGRVTDDGLLRIRRNGRLCARIPADSLVLGGGAPRYKRETKKPEYLDQLAKANVYRYEQPGDLAKTFLELIGSYNLCSRRPLYEQYDTEVGLVRVFGPGSNGGLARVPESKLGIAVSTDCNSRYVYLDPQKGTAQAVFESARNVASTGAKPIGITNNLNFPNPYIPENYYIFENCITGMKDACEFLEIPVTGGNVSFYNESQDGPIFPTPTIGMVGLLENVEDAVGSFFPGPGYTIVLAGVFKPGIGGSEYLRVVHGATEGKIPDLDFSAEKSLIDFLVQIAELKVSRASMDLSLGGLAVAAFRASCRPERESNCTGFELDEAQILFAARQSGMALDENPRLDEIYFGETNGCALVAIEEKDIEALKLIGEKTGVPITPIGKTVDSPVLNFGPFHVDQREAKARFDSGLNVVFGGTGD